MPDRMPSPSAKSIATMIIAIPTARPRMTRPFSKPFETLLNKGAAAQIPPTIRRMAVETTIGIGCASYRRRGVKQGASVSLLPAPRALLLLPRLPALREAVRQELPPSLQAGLLEEFEPGGQLR